MKKNLFLIAVSAVLMIAGCSKENNTLTVDGQIVPKAIVEAFNSQYPGATNVKWGYRNSYTIATFNLPATKSSDDKGSTNSVWYDNNANCLMTEFDRNPSDLPEAVKKSLELIATEKYPGYQIDDIDFISREGYDDIYVIEIEGKGQGGKEIDIDLYFSPDGTLLREVPDTEEDDDDDKYDTMISNIDLEKYNPVLTERYGQYRFIEADLEDDGSVEIEILINRENKLIKIDVVFDKDAKFIYESYEINFKDAPESIKDYIKANYADAEVEDIDVQTTAADEVFYVFEYEIENGDDEIEKTIVLQIGKDGQVTEVQNK